MRHLGKEFFMPRDTTMIVEHWFSLGLSQNLVYNIGLVTSMFIDKYWTSSSALHWCLKYERSFGVIKKCVAGLIFRNDSFITFTWYTSCILIVFPQIILRFTMSCLQVTSNFKICFERWRKNWKAILVDFRSSHWFFIEHMED